MQGGCGTWVCGGSCPQSPQSHGLGRQLGRGMGSATITQPGAVACREAINRLYEAVPGVKGIWKKKVSFYSTLASLGSFLG